MTCEICQGQLIESVQLMLLANNRSHVIHEEDLALDLRHFVGHEVIYRNAKSISPSVSRVARAADQSLMILMS